MVVARDAGRAIAATAIAVLGVTACGYVHAARPAPSSAAGYVSTVYDPAADTTRVRTPPAAVARSLQFYAGFSFAGETLTRIPAEVRLVFQETSVRPRWQDPRGRTLALVLDDTARVTVEETQYRRYVLAARGLVTAKVTEWVWATVPVETFQRIAGASRVDGTIAATHFSLKPEQLAVLRQLARRMAPQGATAAEPRP